MAVSTTLCSGTPTIMVRDNRGLQVRSLRYNRKTVGQVAEQYVETDAYDALGRKTASKDARFVAGGVSTPNFQYFPALAGQMLRTVSADAGETLTFHDINGSPIWQRDARGTVQTFTYDALGRPLSRSEQFEGTGPTCVRECWVYGDTQTPSENYLKTDINDPRNKNLRGQPAKHYDTAGLIDHSLAGFTLQGPPPRQDRTLLAPETPSDWSGTESNWKTTLTGLTVYSSTWVYNALGQVFTQTDTKGHRQRYAYDVAGHKYASWVTPKGQAETPVTKTITYTAGGQILSKADANGVTTDYAYQAQTQRVLNIKATRFQSGDPTILQNLTYTYDPVGNVLCTTDTAAQTQYFDNQVTTAARAYGYDALYQLISATGRENAVGTPSGTDSPNAFAPSDSVNYRNYTRSYTYDLGGNLTQISGVAPGSSPTPTRKIVVAANSNRAILQNSTGSIQAGSVCATFFDAAGNARFLDGNFSGTGDSSQDAFSWNGLNQLQSLVTCQRSGGVAECDRESYAYDGDGGRVRKTRYTKVSGQMQPGDDVVYLPGLELRHNGTGETLEVIVLDDGTRTLNWTLKKPDGIDNLQLRYQITDGLGSSQLELDGTGAIITQEEYYPYGGTAVRTASSASEVDYKTIRYSGKERDAAGLYYYGFRYYQPWSGRWLNTDPAGTVDGLNLYRMAQNNPASFVDMNGHVTLIPLYGLADPRGETANRYRTPDKLKEQLANAGFVTIDHLNGIIGLSSPGAPAPTDFYHKLISGNLELKSLHGPIEEGANYAFAHTTVITSEDARNIMGGLAVDWGNYLMENKRRLDVGVKFNDKQGEMLDVEKIKNFVVKNATGSGINSNINKYKEIFWNFVGHNEPGPRQQFLDSLSTIEKSNLDMIVGTAVFRQTSKMGLDFFVDQQSKGDSVLQSGIKVNMGKVHFTDWNHYLERPLGMTAMAAQPNKSGRPVGECFGEAITHSEYRHATRRKYFTSNAVQLTTWHPEYLVPIRRN